MALHQGFLSLPEGVSYVQLLADPSEEVALGIGVVKKTEVFNPIDVYGLINFNFGTSEWSELSSQDAFALNVSVVPN